MIKVVIKIKGRETEIIVEALTMDGTHKYCAIISSQGIYAPDVIIPEIDIKGMGHIGEGENGSWYPPHQIESIRIHEQ